MIAVLKVIHKVGISIVSCEFWWTTIGENTLKMAENMVRTCTYALEGGHYNIGIAVTGGVDTTGEVNNTRKVTIVV